MAAVLTDDEIEILRLGRTDPDIITNYFFRPEGADKGWKFDYNFEPEGAWQKTLHKATQKRIVLIGGFGSGKTKGVAMSAATWCMTTMDFAFMNCAPVAWQSELMYRFLMDISRNTPFERLIYEKPKKPYPKIELRFWVKNMFVVSTMEFMSVEKNASAILGWEGDWANIDEAGLLDDLEGTVTNLGSRMRGTTQHGRERLGRLSMTTNSWDNPQLWYRFDLANELPEDYLSIVVSTRHNHNVTPDQLRLMLKDIPEDEHERFIDGSRPEGRGLYFSKQKVFSCEDETYGNLIKAKVQAGTPGWELHGQAGIGVDYFRTPPQPDGVYFLLGDPGTGAAPNRNAPALQVWNVANFPKYKASLAAFWWGNGGNSITPFTNQLLRFMADYNPYFTGVDSTGPQKSTAELYNLYLLGDSRIDKEKVDDWYANVDLNGILNKSIGGLDFSGGKKPAYLISARLMIEAQLMVWPKFVVGLRSQLTNYDPTKDTVTAPKIAQDLVACIAMSAYSIRSWFGIDINELLADQRAEAPEFSGYLADRDTRSSREAAILPTIRV
jgi:hypothetical protein